MYAIFRYDTGEVLDVLQTKHANQVAPNRQAGCGMHEVSESVAPGGAYTPGSHYMVFDENGGRCVPKSKRPRT